MIASAEQDGSRNAFINVPDIRMRSRFRTHRTSSTFALASTRAREDTSREGRQRKGSGRGEKERDREKERKKRRNWVKSAIPRRSEIESRFPGRHSEISEISPSPRLIIPPPAAAAAPRHGFSLPLSLSLSLPLSRALSRSRALSPRECFFLLILTDRDGESGLARKEADFI